MNRSEMAISLHKQGYNCAQAVFCAFCDEMNMDIETAARLSSSFGGGMGQLREVCGAVSGMLMAAGMILGYSDPKDKEAKATHYALVRELAAPVKGEYGSIICRELLGDLVNLSPSEFAVSKDRPCTRLVGDAAGILEEYINAKK